MPQIPDCLELVPFCWLLLQLLALEPSRLIQTEGKFQVQVFLGEVWLALSKGPRPFSAPCGSFNSSQKIIKRYRPDPKADC